MEEIEVWKTVEGFEDYEVSNLGRIVSLKFGRRRLLKPRVGTPQPYLRVSLLKLGVTTEFKLHRLVARAFIPNPESKPEVNHDDGIKGNCRVDNLEWATRVENDDHSREVLRKGHQKTPIQVTLQSGVKVKFKSQMDASRDLSLPIGDLNRVLNGRRKTVHGCTAIFIKEQV